MRRGIEFVHRERAETADSWLGANLRWPTEFEGGPKVDKLCPSWSNSGPTKKEP